MIHHSRGLRRELMNDGMAATAAKQWVEQLSTSWQLADLSQPDRGMVDYAVKLTQTPDSISQSDIQSLRDLGFDDRSIHDICSVVAYFAFVNRVADGLGVELEDDPV